MIKTKHIYQALSAKRHLFPLIFFNILSGTNLHGAAGSEGGPAPYQPPNGLEGGLEQATLGAEVPPTPMTPATPQPFLDDNQSLYSGQTGYTQEFAEQAPDLVPETEAPKGIVDWCLDGSSQFEAMANWKPLFIPNPPLERSNRMTSIDLIKHILFNIPGSLRQKDSPEYFREQLDLFYLAAWTTEPMAHLGRILPFTGFNEDSHAWAVILKPSGRNPNKRQQLILTPIEAGRRASSITFETYKLDRRVSSITWPSNPKVALARVVKLLLADPARLPGLQNQYFTCNSQGELVILKAGIEKPEIAFIISQADDIIHLGDPKATNPWDEADMKKARVIERDLDLAGYQITVDSKVEDRDDLRQGRAQNFFIIRNRQMFTRNLLLSEDRLICHNILPSGLTTCIDPAVALCGKLKDTLNTTAPWFTLSEMAFPGLFQVKVYDKNPVKFLGYNKEPSEVSTSLSLMDGIATNFFDEMPKRGIRLDTAYKTL